MKRTLVYLFSTLLIFGSLLAVSGMAQEVRRKAPNPSRPVAASFPAYKPRVANAPRPAMVRDSLGNHVTEDHLHRVDFAQGREEQIMRHDPRSTEAVSLGRRRFANVYRHEFEHKSAFIDTSLHRYNSLIIERPLIISAWRTHNFYGGFYWGFHPILAIDTYFYNPLVYWFYVGQFNEAYYRNWYQADYEAYPDLHQPFSYPGLYYPTENLRQLLFGVSAMPVGNQVHFRQAISIFTSKLAQSLANHFGQRVTLSKGDIVITHYEILGSDDGIELEGFVTRNGTTSDFKGLLNLQSPSNTAVFAPIALDVAPTSGQIQSLDQMNAEINTMKGEPITATPEAPAPLATEPPGEITADPHN